MREFDHVTTDAFVDIYEAAYTIFRALLAEVRELSKKKPDATMNAGKVKVINRVLEDLLTILQQEPEGKYLEAMDDQSLPQMSDGLLIMVQFDAALRAFKQRYFQRYFGSDYWITTEILERWRAEEEAEATEEDEEEE